MYRAESSMPSPGAMGFRARCLAIRSSGLTGTIRARADMMGIVLLGESWYPPTGRDGVTLWRPQGAPFGALSPTFGYPPTGSIARRRYF